MRRKTSRNLQDIAVKNKVKMINFIFVMEDENCDDRSLGKIF